MPCRASLVLLLLASIASAADDLQVVGNRYVMSQLPRSKEAAQNLINQATEFLKTQKADGAWPDIDYEDRASTYWPAGRQLQRAVVMAKAARVEDDQELTAAAVSALASWLEKDFQNPNWWWNQIGVPALIGDLGMLLQKDLSELQLSRCIEIMKRSKWQKWTGQNLVWGAQIQIVRGILEASPQTVAEGFEAIYGVVRIADEGKEGVQSDFSFHQHGAQFYSGGYGLDFALDASRYAAFSWGTKFQMPDQQMRVLTRYVLDGEQWMIRGRTFDYSAVGREIVRIGKSGESLLKGVQMLAELEVPRRPEFQAFAARLRGEPVEELIGNKHFWKSDYMSHRRQKYFTSVKMFSDRLLNTELVNTEGRKSHHLADGANFLYLTGYEYRDIFPVWDWTKVPGATAEQGTLDIGEKAIGVKGKTSFVGGVSDGMYGLAAMDLSRGKLAAKKAWFFFDDEYVCLGAGITCTGDNAVATTVNQCLLRGEVSRGSNWVHHDSVGYVFPRDAKFEASAQPQSGRWAEIGTQSNELLTRDVFAVFVGHAARPQNATYEYHVLPGTTKAETAARASASEPIEVVSNQVDIQAVLHRTHDLLMIAFWNPGRVKTAGHSIRADHSCLLMLRDGKLTAANPQNQAATLTVEADSKVFTLRLPAGPAAGSSLTRDVND